MKRWNDTILATFKQESLERLEALDGLLVDLEQKPRDREVTAEVGRHVHTLKGSAKLLGVEPMAQLAHRLEDALAALGDGRIGADAPLFNGLLEALDAMKVMVETFVAREPVASHAGSLEGLLEALPAPGSEAARVTERPEPAMDAKPAAKHSARPRPKPSLSPPRAAEPAAKAKAGAAREPSRRALTVRADLRKLDTTLNLVGEAVIGHTKSESQLRLSAGFARQCEAARVRAVALREQLLAARGPVAQSWLDPLVTSAGALGAELKELRAALREFRIQLDADLLANKVLLEALHREIAEIRMLPVSNLFARFPRAVRDMAQEHGKLVDIEMKGEDTRLDQKVLEIVEAPLVHILRNAIDHGIEPPEERRQRGKPERGTIRLGAAQEGGRIMLRIEDDGRGMDPGQLREAAVRRGLLTQAEADALSDREAPYLVCARGLSTAKVISDVSGRGVGMDVVARAVEDCKGELTIDTTPGHGTTISVGLPLSLAVTQVLTVEAEGQTYCIPTLSVEMVRMVAPDEVLLVADRPAVKLGRRTVPLFKLTMVLGLGGDRAIARSERLSVVLLSHARQRIALVVDRLVAVQEIVIKTFGRVLKSLPNVAGVTILGTGDVSVVLHPPDLVKHALSLVGKLVPIALSGDESRGRVADQPLLVVEDSLTTREMEKDILASAGYLVDTAVDGRDALEQSRAKSYGLFLVDLQMPVMDGFALIEALRKSTKYAATPIVILSSLGSDQDRRRGLELGADAYLVKSQFNPSVLLDAVRRFVGQAPTRPSKRRGRAR